MNVYVLHYRWDNADTEGTEVLGVYAESNLAAAQKTMRENAALVRSQEEESFWEEDYTWEDEMSISLGNSGIGPGGGYGVPGPYRGHRPQRRGYPCGAYRGPGRQRQSAGLPLLLRAEQCGGG